jgi:hypothetical protein
MPIVYLDYNIIAKAVGLPHSPHAALWRAAIEALQVEGYRFALSAWHAYELAKSDNQAHVDVCCGFVEAIRPLWLSNSVFIKRDEITQFLNNANGYDVYPVRALNPSIAQMWMTYGGIMKIGETYRNTVHEIRNTPGALDRIDNAAAETRGAIQAGRDALADGRYKATQHIVDRDYFSSLIKPPNPKALGYVLDHHKEVLSKCPTIFLEDNLTRIRVREHFQPTDSDAADLQHAMVALAYCDHFVTDDKMLAEHSRIAVKKCGLPCRVHRNPTTIK